MYVNEIGSDGVKLIRQAQNRDCCEHRYKTFSSIK